MDSNKKRRLADVHVPFRVSVPAGQSTFSVNVPKSFDDRKFFFTDLQLVPDFYNAEAAEFGLDTDEELDQLLDFPLSLIAEYGEGFLPVVDYDPGPASTTPALVDILNDHYETTKPEGYEHLVHFYDWTDINWDPNVMTWDQWVRETMALAYYNEAFNEEKHFNKLPQSARTIQGTNNYLFPTNLSEVILESLRFRQWRAPNTRAFYSTNGQVNAMGFPDDQIGPRTANKRYMFENRNKVFEIMMAELPTTLHFPDKLHTLKITVTNYSNNFSTRFSRVKITERDARKNEKLYKAIKDILKGITNRSNFQIDLTYDKSTMMFTFSFPTNELLNVILVIQPELSERIGFKMARRIDRRNPTSVKVDDTPDVKETEKKCRALCYDTGMVIVSDDNTGSNTTAGINELYMATLLPNDTGAMVLSHNTFLCSEPITTYLPSVAMGISNWVPMTFKLHRIMDDSQWVNFAWTNGAFAVGHLRGIPY